MGKGVSLCVITDMRHGHRHETLEESKASDISQQRVLCLND